MTVAGGAQTPAAAASALLEEPREAPLDARERLEALCDPGSVQPVRSAARSPRMGARGVHGDGVVAASATVEGRPVVCYAQDGSFAGGSLGEAHAETILRLLAVAGRARVPVIALVQSAGARVQEGTPALAGYGRIFRETVRLSGRVPQISVVGGSCAGGGSYAAALTDFVVMSERARMFLTGPGVVRAAIGERVEPEDLGGPRVHARNGVADFVAAGDLDAIARARELLSYLPQSAHAEAPAREPRPPAPGDPAELVPSEARRVYDVREVARRIVDGGALLEASPRWARNVVTAFARLDGRPVALVANQPRHLGGVIDAEAAEKAARFVGRCDDFGIPLVVLVDTPGFMPGRREERRGVIRYGAKLLRAFARARVPRVSVVLRQAFGGAYITMNAKDLGADFAFAWPDARIGILGAAQAVAIVNHRELAGAADPERLARALSEAYAAEHQGALRAAEDGCVDEVIAPAHTRERLVAALATLRGGAWEPEAARR